MHKPFQIGDQTIGEPGRLFLFAGPCVIQSKELAIRIATAVRDICRELDVPYVFKASFDKANRTSFEGHRGPGLEAGLEVLAAVKEEVGVPVLTDVHLPSQCARAADPIFPLLTAFIPW